MRVLTLYSLLLQQCTINSSADVGEGTSLPVLCLGNHNDPFCTCKSFVNLDTDVIYQGPVHSF